MTMHFREEGQLIKSMTGYGRAVANVDNREITVEIRSVNNRYLDCNVKMPRVFAFAEDAVKQRVKDAVSRGKVDIYISVNNMSADESVKVSINKGVLEGYLQAMRTMVEEYGVRDDISATSLSRLPDVFVIEKTEEDEEKVTEQIVQVLNQALDAYDTMRKKEGQALEQDLRSRGEKILSLVEAVERRSPITVSEYRARLEAKLREVLESTQIEESRILTEAAIFADKIAVDEETVRLRSHLGQMDSLLSTGGPIGRKLDFLLQEMNREANTIGSKGNDIEQARTVVEIKAELEKIREQTQNIE